MKTKTIVFMALVLVLGCAGPPGLFEVIYDDFYDHETVRMEGNILAGTPPLSVAYVELNAEEYRFRDGKILYNLIVDYSSDDWLFIRQGESLVLRVDEQRIGLKGKGSSGHRGTTYGGRITEKAWYGVSYDAMRMIANAREVRVRIIGSRHEVERYFSKQNFQNFRRFVGKYGS